MNCKPRHAHWGILRFTTILVVLLLLYLEAFTQNIEDEVSSIPIFKAITLEDTISLKQLLVKGVDLEKKEIKYNQNPFQYAILSHKNTSLNILFNYILKNKASLLKDSRNLSAAVYSGNVYALNLILPYQKKAFLKKDANSYLQEFILIYNSFKGATIDDARRYFNSMPDSADVRMLESFLNTSWFDINQKDKYGNTIGIKCRNCANIIPILVAHGLNVNLPTKDRKTMLNYLVEDISDPLTILGTNQKQAVYNNLKSIQFLMSKDAKLYDNSNPWCAIIPESILKNNVTLLTYMANDEDYIYNLSDCKDEITRNLNNENDGISSLVNRILNKK